MVSKHSSRSDDNELLGLDEKDELDRGLSMDSFSPVKSSVEQPFPL